MRFPLHYLLVILSLAFLAGCASPGGGNPQFAKSFESVSSGATKPQVRAALGDPDNRFTSHVGMIGQTTTPGAAELAQSLPLNTPYEVWTYHRGQTDYFIYFASAQNKPKEEWRMVSRKTVPKEQ